MTHHDPSRPLNLFERPATLCWCVPGAASSCAPCRDRSKLAINWYTLTKLVKSRTNAVVVGFDAATSYTKGLVGHCVDGLLIIDDVLSLPGFVDPNRIIPTEPGDLCAMYGCLGGVKRLYEDGCDCDSSRAPCWKCEDSHLECPACYQQYLNGKAL